MFLPWATAEGITEPGQITSRVLDRYTSHLLEHGGKRGPLSRFSIASFVESVNWWLRWMPFRTQHPLGAVVNRPSVWSDR